MRVERLAGIDDPRAAVYRSLRRVAALRRDRSFVAEGARVVRQLLASPLRVRSLLLDERWLAELAPLCDARPEPDLVAFVVSKDELERIVGFHVHQGVMAVAEAPEPPDLFATLGARADAFVVALEGVSNAENVGGILRTVAGFGGAGLLIDAATCDPFVRRAARVSMGAVFRVPVWRTDDLAGTLRALRERCGVRALAAHLKGRLVTLDDADLGGRVAVVLGSEATGLSDALAEACDAAVEIPMADGWYCLNVANAGAVVMWEIARRRRAGVPADPGVSGSRGSPAPSA